MLLNIICRGLEILVYFHSCDPEKWPGFSPPVQVQPLIILNFDF